MPSIIPSPGSAPGPVNMTEGEYWGESYTVAAGEYRHASSIWWMFQGMGTFTNHGTIWYDVALHPSEYSYNWTYDIVGASSIVNDGLVAVIIDMPAGPGVYQKNAAVFSDIRDTSTNSGEIYAISHHGNANVFNTSYNATIINSGLIAAQAFDGWSATSIFFANSGHVINQAGGEILAEAWGATAISFIRGSIVENAGLIEAQSTHPEISSIGIRAAGMTLYHETDATVITNSGTIRADIAIYGEDASAAPSAPTNVQEAVQRVTNLAGGVIDGLIDLNRGDDSLTNRGTIIGDVLMGEGNDVVDTNGGTISGIVDLFWGNDSFTGSAAMDVVSGDDGNDSLTGNGGNDLLFGGANDDALSGGTGNDGLFGEYGNDRIVTQAADVAEGGAGNDRIELGDYSFARVDGGEGSDTLVLASGARKLDLSAALATGRIANFEQIELTGSKDLVIRSTDVANLTGGGSQLIIDATATDKVHLLGTWIQGADQTIGATIYHSYTSNGVTVLVEQVATVALGGSAPAGAIGLDPIASGAAAPSPDGSLGLGYTSNELYLFNYVVTSPIVVNAEETWWNDGYGPVLTFDYPHPDQSLTNFGQIISQNDTTFGSTLAIDGDYMQGYGSQGVVNHGVIAAISTNTQGSVDPQTGIATDWTAAIRGEDSFKVTNDGLILAEAAYGLAIAISWGYASYGTLANDGDIVAYSERGAAIGAEGVMILDNQGSIVASGGKSAIGVQLLWNAYGSQVNDGYIEATTFGPNADRSIGISMVQGTMNNANSTSFTNNGIIVADIALKFAINSLSGPAYNILNNGELHGDVILGAISDKFTNSGLITGITELGAGNDSFNGSNGVQAEVWGGDGNDSVIGGGSADAFFGDAGNDTLTGNGGDDYLEGGAGDDALNGGAGFDIASYSEAAAGVIVSLAVGGAQNTIGAGSDSLNGIEDLAGSAFADRLTGNGSGNYLFGLGGDDFIDGAAGNDHLDGGEGSDVYLINGASDHAAAEIADGGLAGTDEVRFTATGTAQTLVLRAGDTGIERVVIGTGTAVAAVTTGTLAHNVDARTLVNSVAITGNNGANILQATAFGDSLQGLYGIDRLYGYAGNDLLDGGRDADLMYGGTGDDSYVVDNAGDLVYELAGDGTDTVEASVTHYLRANVENLVLTGTASLAGKGNDLANVLTGNAGANRLSGMAGDDILYGNGGRDILDGGTGNDTLIGGTDNDTYVIDSSTDVIVEGADEGVDFVYASASFALSDNVERMYLTGTGDIDGTGNGLANLLVGNDGANALSGMGANDRIYAGNGADSLDGGDGNDYLEGGAGRDEFIGGAGKDYFVFRDGDLGATAETADRILDFATGDRISLGPIDADTNLAGNQGFAFIGDAGFTNVAGQLRYEQIGGNTFLSGDTDGDGIADFIIRLDGLHTILGGDLLL